MQIQQRYYTPEEYLAQEEFAEFRSEYCDGAIVPMTGGTLNHNQIAGNVYAFLKSSQRGKGFNPYIGDLRVWIPQSNQYTYPDIFLIQGEPVFQDQRRDVILNPCLIIEVLSLSTQEHDRTGKFRYYRAIPEFCEYVLINQYAPEIEQYIKISGDEWRYRVYGENHSSIMFNLLNLEMIFDDIYEKVIF